jgi:predicted nucleotidyltransferase
MNPIEGDLIENRDGIFFDVKGLVHPSNKIIAFIRYVPDPNGNREKDGQRYCKFYSLSKRYDLLRKKYPQYLVNDPIFNTLLCEVPIEDIKKHYKPSIGFQKLRNRKNLNPAEKAALHFLEILKQKSGVRWNKLGVSGSILIGLDTPSSDIDLIVYGTKNGYQIAKTMKEILENQFSPFEPYDVNGLKELFDFRSKDTKISFEDFFRTDSRKISHGKFMGKHFFIRFVKNRNEITEQYGNIIYKPIGYSKIEATIVKDSDALFTPCCYKIREVRILEGPLVKNIEEIVSFRGRFCEQATNNENIIAQGKLESVQQKGKQTYNRLLLGVKPTDYMNLL